MKSNESKTAGGYSTQWNLLNTGNIKVPAGIYRAVLTSGTTSLSSDIQVPGN